MTRAKKATEAPTDPLDAMLARLQLAGIRDQLDSLLDEAARANLSARETLILLCEREIARKDHRRIEMALKLAHFPAVKELAGFDFEAQPSIDPKQIRDLAASRWIANGENVLLLGPTESIHTTHLSISLDLQLFLLRIARRRTPESAGLCCLLDFGTIEVVRANDPRRTFAELLSRQRAVLDEAADRGRTDVQRLGGLIQRDLSPFGALASR